MIASEETMNMSAVRNRDHSSEGGDEKSPQNDSASARGAMTWEEMLDEFFIQKKNKGDASRSQLEEWLEKIAPFRMQNMVPPAPMLSKVGRPTVLSPAVKNQLYILLSLGLSRKQAAWYLGFDPSTISHAAKKEEPFAQDLTRAEQLSGLQPHLAIRAASMTNWRAAVWVLQNQNREKSSGE
jgi:hypothetical protein